MRFGATVQFVSTQLFTQISTHNIIITFSCVNSESGIKHNHVAIAFSMTGRKTISLHFWKWSVSFSPTIDYLSSIRGVASPPAIGLCSTSRGVTCPRCCACLSLAQTSAILAQSCDVLLSPLPAAGIGLAGALRLGVLAGPDPQLWRGVGALYWGVLPGICDGVPMWRGVVDICCCCWLGVLPRWPW